MMDKMLTILYEKCFQAKARAESLGREKTETSDRLRQVAIAENKLLSELISIRTDQLRDQVQ